MVERDWQCTRAVRACFCHVPGLKQKEQVSSGHVVICMTSNSMLKNENEYVNYETVEFIALRF